MPTETNVLNLILNLGIVAKIVIFILLVFSTASWATIAERWRYFRRAQDQSRRFLNLFRTQNDFEKVHEAASQWPDSPVANVFRAVYEKHRDAFSDQSVSTGSHVTHQDLVESVYRELDRASHVELAKFEHRLPLAVVPQRAAPVRGYELAPVGDLIANRGNVVGPATGAEEAQGHDGGLDHGLEMSKRSWEEPGAWIVEL